MYENRDEKQPLLFGGDGRDRNTVVVRGTYESLSAGAGWNDSKWMEE